MKTKLHFAVLTFIMLIISSCNLFGLFPISKKSDVGGLSASVSYNGSPVLNKGFKTIRPTLDFELMGFDWTLTGPTGDVKEYKNTQTINDSNLATGIWNVKIVGKNAAGMTIAEGSKDVTIQPVVTTNETIDVVLLQGKGRLRLELSWPVGVLVNPAIVAIIEKMTVQLDGSTLYSDPIDLGFSLTSGNTGAIYEGTDFDSGYYVASIRLLESGETTWGIREAVYIVKDETSSKNYILPGSSLKSRPRTPSAFMIRNYGTDSSGNPEIELAWKDESDNEALFVLERKLSSDTEFTVLNGEIMMDSNRYLDTNLDKSKIYEYRLASKNMWGLSEYTNTISTAFPDSVEIAQDITADQIWTRDNAYVIKGQRLIVQGSTLTIDPGTIVKFEDGASLDIYGTLIADGSKIGNTETIQFSPLRLDAAQGSWSGLTFHGTASSLSVLKNISLSNGRTVKFDDSYPVIDGLVVKNFRSPYPWDDGDENRSVVSFFVTSGRGSETTPYIVKNLEIDNTTFGARIDIAASATGAISFQGLNVTNAVNRALRVTNSSASLALLVQDSQFKASSTGIVLDASNDKTILERCTIEGNSTGVSIGSYGNAAQNGILRDSTIRMNSTGIYLYTRDCQSSTFKIHGNSITSNTSFSLHAFTGSNGLNLAGNDFMSNGDSVYLNGSALTTVDSNTFQATSNGREMLVNGGIGINAAYNYWGTSDVNLIKMKIHDKLDDSSLGEVKFQPFFTKSSLYLKPDYPISGAIVKDYLFDFTWSAYRKPAIVDFILARDAAMIDVVHTSRGDLGFAYRLPNAVRDTLAENTQYYWKVGSVNDQGEVSYGGLNSFVMSQQGIGIDLIQFEEEVSIEDLPETLFRGTTYSARASSTKKPDKYRWTLGSELLQEGTSNICTINTDALGSGNYLLTVKAYYGQRHTSTTKTFSIENLVVSKAWSTRYGTVARLSDGTTKAWGSGFWQGTNEISSLTKVEVNYGDILDYQVSQGSHFWLKQDGTLWAAGNNGEGQLGIGQTGGTVYTPRQVTSSVKSFSIGGQDMTSIFGLLLKADGSVYSWGNNNNGQLGINSKTYKTSPTKVTLTSPVVAVSAGWIHSLALLQDGTVMGWGHNGNNPLSTLPNDAVSPDYLLPTQIPGLTQIEKIHAGFYLSYFIDTTGRLKALGYSQYGNLGIGMDWTTCSIPTTITLGAPVSRIWNQELWTFALTDSGSLYSWGRNYEGILGQGYENENYLNTPKFLAEKVADFGVGRYHAWYLDTDGVLWLWGDNNSWQQGNPETGMNQVSPALVSW